MNPKGRQPTTKPFGEALAELLREADYKTSTGNVNWHAFAAKLDDVHYETLRKAVAGERAVTRNVMQEVADALRIDPSYFVEWRLYDAAEMFDVKAVGFEQALENMARWATTAQEGRRRPKPNGV